MRATASMLLVALVALTSLASLPLADAQGAAVVPRLVSLAAGYGLETWKDEPPLGAVAGGLPLPAQGALGVYENPYATRPHQGAQPWLGHNLTATIALDGGTANHVIAARLDTPGGSIPAKLARVAAGQFTAQFDLDGEAGTERPELTATNATLHVEVLERARDPTVAARRVATAQFPLDASPARFDLGGLALDDGALGIADAGPGNQTLLLPRLVLPGETLSVVADLRVPDAPARMVAWHRTRGATLVEGRTDSAGRLSAAVDAGQLLGANQSGLAILSAHLDGSLGRVANAVLAIPISGQATRITTIEHEPRPLPGGAGDTVRVVVEDLGAGVERPARGTLYVLDAAGQAQGLPLDPASFAPTSTERTARVPVSRLPREQGGYGLLAMLQTGDGRLYSMAQATRGYDVLAMPASAQAFQPGNLTVLVRSRTTNLDALADEGLAMRVRVNLTGLPGGDPPGQELEVDENGEARATFPFLADAGRYTVTINTTGGELQRDATAAIDVQAQARSFLPGFEAGLAVLALALLAQRRRTRS